MKICGPKCSLCGLIISAWGIVQLENDGLYTLAMQKIIRFYEILKHLHVSMLTQSKTEVLMGIFYYVRSVALVEDLPLEEENITNAEDFYAEADRGYSQNAINCWIAACLYIFTFILSGHQFYVNSRSSLTM